LRLLSCFYGGPCFDETPSAVDVAVRFVTLLADLVAAQIHDAWSQAPTRIEAALPLLWRALLR
jgi:hypothetical protein